MSAKLWNWRLWAGFGAVLAGLLTYVFLFLATRAVFWFSLALIVIGAAFLMSGLRRSLREPQIYRGKTAGPVLAIFSVLTFAVFGFASYQVFKHFPAARNAPRLGQPAPQFALADSSGKEVSLAQLLATPIADRSGSPHASKGVLVVFYRGYW